MYMSTTCIKTNIHVSSTTDRSISRLNKRLYKKCRCEKCLKLLSVISAFNDELNK